MKALQFTDSIPRYVVSKAIGALYPPICWSGVACLRLVDVPESPLPGPDWVRIKVRYGGICGSDLHLVRLRDSPATSPFVSFPFTIGHENVGTIAEVGPAVDGVRPGQRVVAIPLLPCAVRGFAESCPACRQGEYQRCERFTDGKLAAGLIIGTCRDTGGSWSPSFVAHRSQLVRLPDHVDDENGLMLEPLTSALHAILRQPPRLGETVLVVGAGVIGLCVVAALRAVGSQARLLVLARHPFQGKLAAALGADEVLYSRPGDGHFDGLAAALGGRLHQPILGRRVLVGGADLVYECVGSQASVEDALRFTHSGGRLVLVGLASVFRSLDWTPIWFKEIAVYGSFAYGLDESGGRRLPTHQAALDLLASKQLDLGGLVTHRFRLEEYRRALATCTDKGRSGLVKAVFAFD